MASRRKAWLVQISFYAGGRDHWEIWASEGRPGPGHLELRDIKYLVAKSDTLPDALAQIGVVLEIAAEDARRDTF